ncbi:hypothetical protein [Haloarcula marina]|uniref:hypothetical protein n=1 Tax=Haloarcula marina TaxID=2961574 RepID=UPI0020B63E74|nr:hypothetical protein [Halomicroarcula marina]
MFPYHVVPDGNAALPHHYVTMLLAALVPVLIVWDDHRDREPWIVLSGILGGVVAFGLVWPRYPVIGATLTLAANAVVILAPFRPAWSEYWPRRHRVAVVVFALIAADDSVQHALGWPMPIDWVWKHGGRSAVVEVFGAVAGV